ncbi:hypothetical protein GobsT_47930 [Gemmata obscuriglobus]|uniref:Flagellar protein n=1 Tax=Gemmata obscuriglobus TaxID=114 RepID=A0A2Z3GU25_9BACT|nr:hypothetical protein [Gemmata obscuriglobus]AWM37263.1 hypothetical protein C1280_09650 [Gemmata obscuriglobus]QEG29994.1 hypothetical protein GobsT_47930 [Gemmata obscuriglobus]VTS09312.1 unnamed protein product [Gemmata obscuriglobus UQM 2246]
MTRTVLALAALLASTAHALAGDGFDYAPPVAPAPPDLGGLVTRLLLLTLALVGLCAGTVWWARRANRPAGGAGDGGGHLKLEGSLPLDRTCAVHLIAVDGQTVALTTDGTGLRSLVVLSETFETALEAVGRREVIAEAEPEPAAPAPKEPEPPKWSADDVSQLLQRIIRRADGPGVHLEPALRHDQP